MMIVRRYLSALFVASCVCLLGASASRSSAPPSVSCHWNVVQTPNVPNGDFRGSSGSSPSDVWAVGSQANFLDTLTEHFDGANWTIIPSPNPGPSINVLQAITSLRHDDAWAVGQTSSLSVTPVPLIERWDGQAWTVDTSGPSVPGGILYGITAIAPADIWSVGVQGGQNWQLLTEHFDGSRWYRRFAPTVGVTPQFFAVSAGASNDVWAVGETFDGHDGFGTKTLAEHWDGQRWRFVPTMSPSNRNYFFAVKAFSSTDVWAAGFTAPPSSKGHALIEHWDGSTWSVVPNPAGTGPSSIIYTLTGIAPDEVWALGQVNESHALLAERWDGTKWSKVFVGQPQDGSASFRASYDAERTDVWGFGTTGQPLAENYCRF